jgi:hypothetical protein
VLTTPGTNRLAAVLTTPGTNRLAADENVEHANIKKLAGKPLNKKPDVAAMVVQIVKAGKQYIPINYI